MAWHMTMMQGDQQNVVTVPIPGVDGISLVYSQGRLAVDSQRVQSAATIIAHWLTHPPVQIHPRQVRDALRRFTSPWLLGDTELAHMLFDNLHPPGARGAALQSLLQSAVEQIAPTHGASTDRCRGYHIVRQLYIERQMPQQISRELGLSGRQYQRCLYDALVGLSEMLVRGL